MKDLVAGSARSLRRRPNVILAIAAYLPILLTKPGMVSADTKSYLTIDPQRLLSRAWSMWDPSIGAGTVTHQNIGYLFPLGPYYWVMDRIGIPDWVTQRLLWGTMVFAAAAGVLRLARSVGWATAPAFVAATSYAFTPYVLSYLARLSVILGPWAAMPWLILLANRAVRQRPWRAAAWFSVVVLLVGSVNATSLLYVGLAPVIWTLIDFGAGRIGWRRLLGGWAAIGVLTAAVSSWWIIGLRTQGVYGLPILRFTETYRAVASSSTPTEILRGLGYWFFYGGDRSGPWVGPAPRYVAWSPLIALGYLLAGFALLGLCTKFAGRAHAAVLLLVGLAVSVGAAPLSSPSAYGALFRRFADTTSGLAMRSTPRAAPLVLLALAFGLGSLAQHATQWVPRRPRLRPLTRRAPLVACGLIVLQMWPWFTGSVLTSSLLRDEHLPAYRQDLAAWLDETGTSRVYELPGSDFAMYRWGGTVDTILPGMIDRPTIARELVPFGGFGTADLLNALEHRIAEGRFEPASLVPVARLFGAGTIVVRNDIQNERFTLARLGTLWADVRSVLGAPDFEGGSADDSAEQALADDLTVAHRLDPHTFPAVAAFNVDQDQSLASLSSASAPIILVGSGEGIVDAAAAGLIDGTRPIIYDAVAANNPDTVEGADNAWIIVTDSNRRQAMRWSTISSNYGALEMAGEVPLTKDPSDNRLPVLPDGDSFRTVLQPLGDLAAIQASGYGNQISLTAEDAASNAIDGDPTTAWKGAVFEPSAGLRLMIRLAAPVRAPWIRVLQPAESDDIRMITELEVRLDGTSIGTVQLDGRSRLDGQQIPLPDREFSQIDLIVRGDDRGELSNYAGQPGVALSEVVIPGADLATTVRTPAVAAMPASDTAQHRLSYALTRLRLEASTPNRADPELTIDRMIEVPTSRLFQLHGTARLAGSASDALIDQSLGLTGPWTATASGHLDGNPASRAGAAIDGDLTSAWETPSDDVVGSVLHLTAPTTVTASSLRLTWLDDGLHSLPTAIRLSNSQGDSRLLDLTSVGNGDLVTFAPLSGDHFQLTIDSINPLSRIGYYTVGASTLPVGLAEVDLAGARSVVPAASTSIDGPCRTDLLTIDGRAVAVRVDGTIGQALHGDPLDVELCGDPITLSAGTHRLQTAKGAEAGFDLDRVVLDSAGPEADAAATTSTDLSVTTTLDSARIEIPATTSASWLVFRQSWNAGWSASIDGVDLGPPTLIDGYANGWLVPPGTSARTVDITYTPQRLVTIGEWMSVGATLVVLAILLQFRRRRGSAAPLPDAMDISRRPHPNVRRLILVAALWFVGGAAAAVASLAVMVYPTRWRWRAPALILTCGAIAAAQVVILQTGYAYPSGPDWPSRFSFGVPFVWAAVAAAVTAALHQQERDGALTTHAPV